MAATIDFKAAKFQLIFWGTAAVAIAICAGIWFFTSEEQELAPGVCTDEGDGQTHVVKCDDSDARYKVVYSPGTADPINGAPSCEVGEAVLLTSEEYKQSGIGEVWCLVDIDEVTPEIEELIEKAKRGEEIVY